MKHLLIVYHTQGVKNERMAKAVLAGATDPEITATETRLLQAFDAGPDDLMWADGLVLVTPENFGYMSGAMKDFFDRTFYPCEGKIEALPYAICIGCGNDGTGALTAVRRIARGYPFREVAKPIIVRGDLRDEDLEACRELGTTLAAGVEMGVY